MLDTIQADTLIPLSIQHSDNSDVLIEVSGTDTVYELLINGRTESERRVYRVPNSRLPPLYMVLSADEIEADFRAELRVIKVTDQSSLSVRIFALGNSTSNDRKLASAYRLYGVALEVDDEGERVHASNVAMLHEAAENFEELKQPELSQWANAMAAKFLLWPELNFVASLDVANKVLAASPEQNKDRLELMMHNLKGVVFTEMCEGNPYPSLMQARLQALEEFEQAAEIATRLDWEFEKAWALNNSGITNFYLHNLTESIHQYDAALAIASAINAPWFIDRIQQNIANNREIKGTKAALLESEKRWLDSVQKLRVSGQVGDQSHALIALGRVYLQLHKFPESIAVLSEALELQSAEEEVHESGRAYLWLAQAYRSVGNLNRAKPLFDQAITLLESADSCRYLHDAFRAKATLARQDSDWESMKVARDKQAQYSLTGLDFANYHFDSAQDKLADSQAGNDGVQAHFEEALRGFPAEEFPAAYRLGVLQVCATALENALDIEGCDAANIEQSFALVADRTSPKIRLESTHHWARALLQQGQKEKALAQYTSLIEAMSLYRQRLPGVLGSWYWESRNQIFSEYLQILIEQDLLVGSGERSLIALNNLRNLEMNYAPVEVKQSTDTELRTLLLSLDADTDQKTSDALQRRIDVLLGQVPHAQYSSHLFEGNSLGELIERLPKDTGVLTYYFSGTKMWRWFVTRENGIQLSESIVDAQTGQFLTGLKSDPRGWSGSEAVVQLEQASDVLLHDLSDELPEVLLLLTGGPLNGFPFDALPWRNGPLFESTTVVNAQSLNALSFLEAPENQSLKVNGAFLAGAWDWSKLGMPDLAAVPEELAMVASSFPAVDSFVAQGIEFSRQSILSQQFRDADLIHIASHSESNLTYPELSRFYLGDANNESDYLTPYSLLGKPVNAKLVVLSACETSGSNQFAFDSNQGFVSAFMANGAESVLATLWPIRDSTTSAFMGAVYANLGEDHSIIRSFGNAKREVLAASDSNDSKHLSAFQLYIR